MTENVTRKTRITGEKIEVDQNQVLEFWNKRAEKYNNEHPYVTIKFSDKHAEAVDEIDSYEKTQILSQLNVQPDWHMLDIGCGVGRLADFFIPQCKCYIGTDFSKDILAIAKKRVSFPGKDYGFDVCSFQDTSESEMVKKGGLYQCVLISGVGMYINDEELLQSFTNLLPILDKHCTIYIYNTIATVQRLTLIEFYSDDLNSNYHVIYRTKEEYVGLFDSLFKAGFCIEKDEFLVTNIANHKETNRHYYILSR